MPPAFTLDQIIDELDEGNHWSQSTITFSFRTGSQALTTDQVAMAREAFALWSDVCGLTFQEVAPGTSGDITFGAKTKGFKDGELANAADISNAHWLAGTIGNIWVNSGASANNDTGVGGSFLTTIMHEIGHVLGLDHPGDYNGVGLFGALPTYEDDASYAQATTQYTVMSYFDASYSGGRFSTAYMLTGPNDPTAPDYDRVIARTPDGAFGPVPYQYIGVNDYSPATPMLHDIAAIQSMYGANNTTRSGNTTYGFNSNAGRDSFDFTENDQPIVCIWDAGGVDVLNVSGYSTDQKIDLREGHFSDIGSLEKNVSIAFGTVIENATAGSGDDTITGNVVGNRLSGNNGHDVIRGLDGNDWISGGSGNDYLYGGDGPALLFGGLSFFTNASADDGIDRLFGGTGNDHLFGGSNNDILDGGGDNDALHGGSGNDRLIASYGNDQLFGDAGLDTFEIRASSLVTTIRDFEPFTVTGVTWSFAKGISYSFDHEKIDLTAFNFDDYNDLMSRAAEVNGDAYLVLDTDSYVIIEDVSLSDLSAANFLL
jgi:serralysin